MPAVVAVQGHGFAPPVVAALGLPKQRGGNDVVTIAKNIGPDINRFADNAFDRITTALDARVNVLNTEARTGDVGRGDFPSLERRLGTYALIVTLRTRQLHG